MFLRRSRPQNVYLLGTPYSGSTLLANALNAHTSIANAGELSSCFSDFPLGVHNPFCPVCAAAVQPCPVWSPDFIQQVRKVGPVKAMDLIRRATGSSVVVDASKFPDWMSEVYKKVRVRVPVRIISIMRNPFAFHASNLRRVQIAAEKSAEQWLHVAHSIPRVASELNADFLGIRYEDFAFDPAQSLSRICAFLNISDESQRMTEFWEFPIHALNGNAGAYMWYRVFRDNARFELEEDAKVAKGYAQRRFGGWVDDKWKSAISDEDIAVMMNYRALISAARNYGYSLEQELEEAGRLGS